MTIGENIKKYRKEKNYSQRFLAEKIGVTGQFVSLIEKGGSSASIDTLIKIADVLDVSIDDLSGTAPTKNDFDYSDLFSKNVLDEATNMLNDDQKAAFIKMRDRALENLGIIEGLKYGDMIPMFLDHLYLSVSFTEIFIKFNNEMQSIISSEKTNMTIDEANTSIEVTAKYTFEAYNLLRKNMKLLEESEKFYTMNEDKSYFEKEIFEKYLNK